MCNSISIALTTYNGAKFLPDLLQSILHQEVLPNEVIICDDMSNDETLPLLRNFSADSPFKVRIFRNSVRLGVTRNFYQAISLCTSDVVVLADQDDSWMPDKLKQLSLALRFFNSAAVFSDAAVVAEDLASLGYTMWERVGFDRHEQKLAANGQAFDVLLKHRVVTGATLAFRKSFIESLLPIPSEWPHDEWIAFIAAATDGILPIDKCLIRYRQHSGNVTGGRKKNFWEDVRAAMRLNRLTWYNDDIHKLLILRERLDALGVATSIGEKLSDKIAHLQTRMALPHSRLRRLPIVAHEVASGRYAAYARNWGSIAIDLLLR